MPKVSTKRQVTLPASICEELGIHAGDEVEILRYRDKLNIIKKETSSAAGILKGIKVNKAVSEKQRLPLFPLKQALPNQHLRVVSFDRLLP